MTGTTWTALALLAFGLACRSPADATPGGLELALQVSPTPPTVGAVLVDVAVKDETRGGTLRLEGDMTHPGMRPSFGDCRELAPGHYQGSLELTMPGDWLVQVDASFPDGRRARRVFPLPGVRPAP